MNVRIKLVLEFNQQLQAHAGIVNNYRLYNNIASALTQGSLLKAVKASHET